MKQIVQCVVQSIDAKVNMQMLSIKRNTVQCAVLGLLYSTVSLKVSFPSYLAQSKILFLTFKKIVNMFCILHLRLTVCKDVFEVVYLWLTVSYLFSFSTFYINKDL